MGNSKIFMVFMAGFIVIITFVCLKKEVVLKVQ